MADPVVAPDATETPAEPEPVAEDPDADKCPVCGLLTDNRCSHQ